MDTKDFYIYSRRHGFTLIELSIVIVIIGLIVGGVLVGRDMIASATIRSQISQVEEFNTAVNAFKDKYGYLPGDMPPDQTTQLGFFTFTGTYAGRLCNGYAAGNNDGLIMGYNEGFPFWQHLSEAKMIKWNPIRTGLAGEDLKTSAAFCAHSAGTPNTSISTNAGLSKYLPAGKLDGTYLYATSNRYTSQYMTRAFSGTQKQNMFTLTAYDSDNADVYIYGRIISANQAFQMDSKIDDGIPERGNIRDLNTATWGILPSPPDYTPCTSSGSTPKSYDLSPATANSPNCLTAILW